MSAPYDEGAAAFRSGQPRDACPYEDGSLKAMSWVNGWRRAEWEDGQ